MLHSIVLGVHLIVAIMIVGLVLLQRGKGAEAGTGFGAGASGTVFGARGSANFLSRATGVLDAPAQTAPASQEPPTSEPSGATQAPPAATDLPQLPKDAAPAPAGDAP